jgi:cytochrome d ubiquinol oxidase subunit I
MLFGWKKVSAGWHYFATICVCAGAHFSAVWFVIANAWMQTPAGYKVVGEGLHAKAVVTDFWAMVFNPSSMERLCHVVLGCWLAGIFLILSVSGYYFLKNKYRDFSQKTMKIGLIMAAIVLVLQLISADISARGVAFNQPSKLAAMEGVYATESSTPLYLFGWVDEKTQTVKGIKIPGLLSYLVYRNFETPIQGFDQIPPENRPPINVVFQTYHLMIAMWGLMALVTALGLYYWKRKKLAKAKWLLWALILSVLFPQVANQVGWMTAEIGRQPWVVYGILRTTDGVSPTISATQVGMSIGMFILIYTLLFILFLFLLDRKIKHGPIDGEEDLIYASHAPAQGGNK